jgi:hypothetical protein
MTFTSRVEAVRDWMLSFLNKNPLFLHHTVTVASSEPSRMGYGLTFQLEEDTYVSLHFFQHTILLPVADDRKKEKRFEEVFSLSAEIPSVFSSLGHGTGFFLLHLIMALAVAVGASEIKLDNATNEPVRAVRGIYRLFEANTRLDSKGYVRRMTQANKNRHAERVHYVREDSMDRIHKALFQNVVREVEKEQERGEEERVWREDAPETIHLLFRRLKQHVGGGSLRPPRKVTTQRVTTRTVTKKARKMREKR